MGLGTGLTLAFLVLMIVTAIKAVAIVPQSEEYVIERLGKFRVTLNAGINILVPWLDNVAHRVVVLERQLDAFKVSVITADNVEIQLETTTFFRVTDAAKSVYRIRDIPLALKTTAESTIRNEAGKLELDALQSSRDQMNDRILENLREAAALWGLEVTRSEITDVQVDQQTKDAQRQQLNAERERRATVARAEGERARVQLEADAQLYAAQKQAEAVKITADADAYATVKTAQAEAQQTKVIAQAIADNGKPAIDYDILKRQVEAIGVLAASDNAKTIVLPTDVTKTVGALAGIQDLLKSS